MSLHLRSRRIGLDEAVFSTIDLLSTLLARLGGRSEDISESASPRRRMRHAAIQQTLDTAINVLQSSPMAHLVRPGACCWLMMLIWHLRYFCRHAVNAWSTSF